LSNAGMLCIEIVRITKLPSRWSCAIDFIGFRFKRSLPSPAIRKKLPLDVVCIFARYTAQPVQYDHDVLSEKPTVYRLPFQTTG